MTCYQCAMPPILIALETVPILIVLETVPMLIAHKHFCSHDVLLVCDTTASQVGTVSRAINVGTVSSASSV